MVVEKADILFPFKKDARQLTIDDAITKEFLKQDDKNQLGKKALQNILLDLTRMPSASFQGRHFAADLQLSLLVKEFFKTEYACPFVYSVLKAPPNDLETILFRQGIFKELEQDKPLEQIECIYRTLTSMITSYQRTITAGRGVGDMVSPYYYPLESGEEREHAAKMALLFNYLKAVDMLRYAEFSSGLDMLREYATQISESREYEEMACHLRSFSQNLVASAHVEITFNELGGVTKQAVIPTGVEKGEGKGKMVNFLKNLNPFYLKVLFDLIDSLFEKNQRDILTLTSYVGELEYYLGASTFTKQLDKYGIPNVFPRFGQENVVIRGLHNPLLAISEDISEEFRSVPNDVCFGPDKKLYVLTGPNDGGKSVFLKTIGLIALLGQNGCRVPAQEGELVVFDDIYTHIIPKDDIRQHRGRYREELGQLRYIFDNATSRSLILLDEPCGGTDPGQGSKQSVTALQKFYRWGSYGMFATHMHNVSEEVENGQYPFAHNLQVGIEVQDGKPVLTYKVSPGRAGLSYGDLIAKEEGVDEESLDALYDKRFSIPG